MLTSLSLIFLVGLAMGAICSKLKLPRIIGMLATGIILGPYVLDLLDPSILSISAELRKMALVIILLKAGLSLNLQDLKKVGRPAIMLSFVPATFEIIGYILSTYHPRIDPYGSRCYGRCSERRISCCGYSAHGAVDGQQIRYRSGNSTDDYGWRLL